MLLVAAAVVIVIIAAAPSVGATITKKIMCAIAGGGNCAAGQVASRKPDEPCAVNKQANAFDASVTVASVKLGGGGHFLETTMSDGSVKVTVTGTAVGGGQFGIGEYAGVTVGDTTYGEGATASVSITANAEAGNTWQFTGPDAKKRADSFMGDAQAQTAQDAVTGSVPLLGDAVGWGMDKVFGKWSPPTPDSSYMAVGAGVSADGKASFGAGGASGGAGLKGLIGLRKNKDGTSVGYFEVSDELAGKAGVLGRGASGSAGAKGVVAVTFDANHHATQLKLSDSIDASGGLSGVTDNTSSLAGMAQSAVFGPDQKNTGREVEATLDLTNPANHAAAANFLSAVGVNVLDGSNPRAYQNSYDAGKALFERFRNDGKITLLAYNGDTSGLGIAGEGGLGIEFGADASYSSNNQHLTSAQYWNGTGWQTWADCQHG